MATDPCAAVDVPCSGHPGRPVRDRLGEASLISSAGIFWDDWIYVSITPAEIRHSMHELGLPWVGYLLVFLVNVGASHVYHALSLLW